MTSAEIKPEDFPSRTFDKLRFGDTDSVGHVNNAAFSTFYETGRTHLVHAGDQKLLEPGFGFVLAHISIDYLGEILWPGQVDIASGTTRIGNSSVHFAQALFQNGQCVSRAKSIIVLTDRSIRRSHPLPDAVRAFFEQRMIRSETLY